MLLWVLLSCYYFISGICVELSQGHLSGFWCWMKRSIIALVTYFEITTLTQLSAWQQILRSEAFSFWYSCPHSHCDRFWEQACGTQLHTRALILWYMWAFGIWCKSLGLVTDIDYLTHFQFRTTLSLLFILTIGHLEHVYGCCLYWLVDTVVSLSLGHVSVSDRRHCPPCHQGDILVMKPQM